MITWIAGYMGVVLGYGSTAADAAEDALDFCNASLDGVRDLDVREASDGLRLSIVLPKALLAIEYVIRDGKADVR